MNFSIAVVHDLTNDISYDAKLNKSKICYFGTIYLKFCEKIARNWKIFVVSIFDILV